MPLQRSRFHGRNRKRRARLALFLFFAAAVLLFIWFNIALVPVLKASAVNKAKVVAIDTINDAVGKVLKKDNISYDTLISFDKNANGDITAVNANTMEINLLKYDITNEVVRELSEVGGSDMKIPVGTVIGGQLFTGRGPNIHIRFQPIGNVNSEVTSSFSAAGINQTRQQIMLDVKADITVIISSYNVSTSVDSNYIIADSVIVGSVPGSYTVVEGTDDGTDKLFIYGKSGSGSSGPASSGKK